MDTNKHITNAFQSLKTRIKKNEGYSNKPYKDQLGYDTIGYGHLIKPHELKYFKKKLTRKYFTDLFEQDFAKAHNDYKKNFYKKKHNSKEKELLIEMIFQMGKSRVLKLKKMHFHLNSNNKYMVCLEMMDSLWYKQTPERVSDLIKNYLGK